MHSWNLIHSSGRERKRIKLPGQEETRRRSPWVLFASVPTLALPLKTCLVTLSGGFFLEPEDAEDPLRGTGEAPPCRSDHGHVTRSNWSGTGLIVTDGRIDGGRHLWPFLRFLGLLARLLLRVLGLRHRTGHRSVEQFLGSVGHEVSRKFAPRLGQLCRFVRHPTNRGLADGQQNVLRLDVRVDDVTLGMKVMKSFQHLLNYGSNLISPPWIN